MTLFDYVKSRKYILLLLLLCSAVHVIVLFVYGHETEPVWYATVLFLVLMVLIGFFDFWRQRKKYKVLQDYDVNGEKSLHDLVTETNPVATQYCNIISALQENQREQDNSYRRREKEASDFYTMWVHQIKTPIAALQVLLQTDAENISGMKGELFKIERYVDVVLNYLRMDDMNSDLLLKRYSLESMVKQAVKKYTPLFIQSRLSLKLEDLDGNVLTDEKWMVFVLEQILSNALKYTKKGGIRDGCSPHSRLCIEEKNVRQISKGSAVPVSDRVKEIPKPSSCLSPLSRIKMVAPMYHGPTLRKRLNCWMGNRP